MNQHDKLELEDPIKNKGKKEKLSQLLKILEPVTKELCYAIGVTAYRMIQVSDETQKNPIRKLNILQGGIEPRFVTSLSEITKKNIRECYKVTQSEEIKVLASQVDIKAV